MMMRWLLYVTAVLAFIAFWTAGFGGDQSRFYLVSSAVLFVTSLLTWIGAIYIWSVARKSGRSHVITLIMLVPFGFMIGWLYVLLRAHELTRARNAAAA